MTRTSTSTPTAPRSVRFKTRANGVEFRICMKPFGGSWERRFHYPPTRPTHPESHAPPQRNMTAKRLLSDKSSSTDWEKTMISKLKAKMGALLSLCVYVCMWGAYVSRVTVCTCIHIYTHQQQQPTDITTKTTKQTTRPLLCLAPGGHALGPPHLQGHHGRLGTYVSFCVSRN